MSENVSDDGVVVVVDYSFQHAAIYVDGNLVWAHDADDAIDRMPGLTGVPLTATEESLWDYEGGTDALEIYAKRVGVPIFDQESIFPPNEGRWTHVPNTLAAVRALSND